MEFILTDNYGDYQEILERRICDFICKHVMSLESKKAKQVYNISNSIGYGYVMWGHGSGVYKNYENNRIIQLNIIQRMVYEDYSGPFRIVIDKEGTAWIDNLHTAVRDIMVYGKDVKVSDVGAYIIDFSKDITTVVTINNSVTGSLENIQGAIKAGEERLDRICTELKGINYTIKEFISDNAISKDFLTISEQYFEDYIKKHKMT